MKYINFDINLYNTYLENLQYEYITDALNVFHIVHNPLTNVT